MIKFSKVFLKVVVILVGICCVGFFSLSISAHALPFNDDMAKTPALVTGRIARSAPADSVSIGSLKDRVASKEEALKLTNPNGSDLSHVKNGKRLFAVNCTPCHGTFTETGVEPSPVMAKTIMPGPDLGVSAYADRPDGLFYGTIHFGGLAVMPRVGFKLSAKETWDIVSYIRSVQNNRKAQ